MATITVTVDIKEDGQTLPGFPSTTAIVTNESQGRATFVRASDPAFAELSLGELGDIQVLYVAADQVTSLRFNDQSDAGLPLNPGGYLLMVGGAIPSGATSKAALQNNSGANATVTQIAAGS